MISLLKLSRTNKTLRHFYTTIFLPDGGYISRKTYCSGLKCFVYHEGQPSQKWKELCTNCWKDDHFRNQCKNAKCCKVCHKEAHEPGSQLCDVYVESQNSVQAFAGKHMILSNFYPTTIDIVGVKHQSAEHAVQYVKTLRCGALQRATAIKEELAKKLQCPNSSARNKSR